MTPLKLEVVMNKQSKETPGSRSGEVTPYEKWYESVVFDRDTVESPYEFGEIVWLAAERVALERAVEIINALPSQKYAKSNLSTQATIQYGELVSKESAEKAIRALLPAGES